MKKLKYCYYAGLLIAALLIRSLTWNSNSLNIDELGWIYLLHRIHINSIPFEGFVAHTTGPLAIYLLSILNVFQEIPTLAGLRQFQFIFCIVPTFYFLYKSVTRNGRWFSLLIFFLFIITNPTNDSLKTPVNDFFAYNTEFLLMMMIAAIYYLQKEKSPSNVRIFLVVFLSSCLFFVKSQAIVFTLYFLTIYILQLFFLDKRKVYFFFLFLLVLTLLLIGVLLKYDLWDAFVFEYLYKNFLYTHLGEFNLISQSLLVNQVFAQSILFFWITGGVIFLYFSWRIIKYYDITFFSYDSMKAVLLLLISLVVIFVSTNNFTHYKVFLFFPMSLAFGEAISSFPMNSIKVRIQIFVLVMSSYFVMYRSIFFEVYSNLSQGKLTEYKNSMGTNPILAYGANPFWSTNNRLDQKERTEVLEYMNQKLNANAGKSKIYIFGWFVSQGYYYELLKMGLPVSKSAQNQYLLEWFFKKDEVNYQKEEWNLILEFIKDKPDWIIDSESVLLTLKNRPIEKFIRRNYRVAYRSTNFVILQIK